MTQSENVKHQKPLERVKVNGITGKKFKYWIRRIKWNPFSNPFGTFQIEICLHGEHSKYLIK